MDAHKAPAKKSGFTLIEVLLVIVVIGLMVAAVQFNFNANKPETQLEQESMRFAGVFNLASEYGLLNNIELGLFVEKNTYQFVGYDGVKWSPIPEHNHFSLYELPETIAITLAFDDLPIEEPILINRELFTPDEETLQEIEEGLAEDETPLIPQVYILSGGDITPFQLQFTFEQNFTLTRDVMFTVTGLYSTPVEIKGPFIDGEMAGGDNAN